jgi:uncharacterized protein (TIGR04222 family)
MDIFDLRGPEFLFIYFCFSLFVVLALWLYRRYAESGLPPKFDLSDPYLIAYLRGGENETLRLAVLSLVDRGLLVADDSTIQRAVNAVRTDAKTPLEAEILRKAASKTEASAIFKDAVLLQACAPYRTRLQQIGLLPDAETKRDRWRRFGLALLPLLGLAGVKIIIGLERERPVGFLVVLGVIALVFAAIVSFPRLTGRGREALKNIQSIYAGLKDRAQEIRPGYATADMMMCAAIFGAGALGASEYAYAQRLFPQSSSSSSGSSCGSSSGGDGGGGGCGGGGCGGCGS